MDERRKCRKKRVGHAILRLHPATHQSRDRSLATGAKHPLFVRSAALDKVEKINNPSCWRIPYDVQVASRYDYEIAGRQQYRLGHALDFDPALSLRNDVKSRPSVIDAEAPWRAKLGPVICAGSKTDRMQKIVDQSFAPSVSGDVHMNITTDAWREALIDNLLHSIRFRSSAYYRPELRAPWGFSIDVRGPSFHIVSEGKCW